MLRTLLTRLVLLLAFVGLLSAQGTKVDFRGSVESLPASSLIGDWEVAGRTVRVTAATSIDQERGPVAVGACVSVQGAQNQDNSVQATEIEVKPGLGGCAVPSGKPDDNIEFRGVVQNKPASGTIGVWQISGRKVDVTAATRVLPEGNPPGMGSCVLVQGTMPPTGNIAASRIQGQGQGVCLQGPEDTDESKLIGKIEALPASGLVGDWKVANNTVRVSTTTVVNTDNGPVAVGVCAEVRGPRDASQVILATRIATEQASECDHSGVEFSGVVESMPASGLVGLWKISSRDVQTTNSTQFDTEKGQPKIGACVEVKGTQPASGPLAASSLEVKSVSGTCIFHGGVTNAASFANFAISPNQIVSIFGANIGPATQLPMVIDEDHLATRLGNTQVTFDGVPAAMTFAARGQINAVVPCAVAGKTSTNVQVTTDGAVSNSQTVPVVPAAPALFTLSSSGTGRAAALNYDAATKAYTVNDPSNRAPVGSVVVLYGTGFGLTSTACVDGGINRAPNLGSPKLPVTATVGGKNATINYVGDAPDLIRGVFQVNIVIPADAPTGPNIAVVVKVGDRTTQDGATIATR
jgi:uncharacterized protein (TIGR03437 family)